MAKPRFIKIMLSLTRVLALSSLLCVFFVITLTQDVFAQSPTLDFSALKKQFPITTPTALARCR